MDLNSTENHFHQPTIRDRTQHVQAQNQPQFTSRNTGQVYLPFVPKNANKMFGVSPSDIDKYSRVVFPVCFVCFNLLYWIIYLHISHVLLYDEN